MTFSVKGTVSSGLGKGKEFVSLEPYTVQFEDRLGYRPYPGTLNLEVSTPIAGKLDHLSAISIEGWEDSGRSFGAVSAYPVRIRNRSELPPIHLIVPNRTDHDTSTIELISPVKLRDRLSLIDGSTLEISVDSGKM